jgi:hypothetical protein
MHVKRIALLLVLVVTIASICLAAEPAGAARAPHASPEASERDALQAAIATVARDDPATPTRVAPTATLRGVVVDSADRPIGGAGVSVRSGFAPGDFAQRVTSAADGSFELSVPAELLLSAIAVHDGRISQLAELHVPIDRTREIRLRMRTQVRVEGQLREASGAVLPGHRIRLTSSAASFDSMVTDEAGRFAFELLWAERVVLGVEEEFETLQRKEVPLPPGASRVWIDFVVERRSALAGRLVTETGEPIVARVHAYEVGNGGSGAVRSTSTAPDGSFRFAQLRPGATFDIAFQIGPEFTPATLLLRDVPGDRADLLVVADERARAGTGLDFEIVDWSGRPMSCADIDLERVDSRGIRRGVGGTSFGSLPAKGLQGLPIGERVVVRIRLADKRHVTVYGGPVVTGTIRTLRVVVDEPAVLSLRANVGERILLQRLDRIAPDWPEVPEERLSAASSGLRECWLLPPGRYRLRLFAGERLRRAEEFAALPGCTIAIDD